ncbi:MAG: hypothetical protein U9N86_03210, partial [Bacteroidota bacterium]|nr:hypothetical protein [Bacteroidota bacterium]
MRRVMKRVMKTSVYPSPYVVLFAFLLVLGSCNTADKAENYQPLTPKLTSDIMTPEVLWSFGRLGGVDLSPDQTQLLFGISYYSKENNRSYRDLYMMPVEGGERTVLTNTPGNEYNAVWRPDGKKIGFLRAGKMFEM